MTRIGSIGCCKYIDWEVKASFYVSLALLKFQFPAEDATAEWRTTHFDYHAIDQCVLKLDILGHSDPTQLRLIQLQSGTDIMKVPMDDKATMSIFTSTEALGVTTDQIL